ncbi:MAG: hypothetical protein V8S96_06035 [Lachnospiraceae bacterium]
MIGDTQEHPYKGIFDGNGQRVVYLRTEISLKDPDRRYAGLFGVIDGGTVKNVTVLGKCSRTMAIMRRTVPEKSCMQAAAALPVI